MRNRNIFRMIGKNLRRYLMGCLILAVALFFLTTGCKNKWHQDKENHNGILLQGTMSAEDASRNLPAMNKINGIQRLSKVVERDLKVRAQGKECSTHATGIDNALVQDKLLAGDIYERSAMRCVVTKDLIYHLNYGDGNIKEQEKARISVTDWLGKKIQIQSDVTEKNYSLMICGIVDAEGAAVYMPLPVMERLCKEGQTQVPIQDSGENMAQEDGDEDTVAYRFLLSDVTKYPQVANELGACKVVLDNSYEGKQLELQKKQMEIRQDFILGAVFILMAGTFFILQISRKREETKAQEMDLRVIGMSLYQVRKMHRITRTLLVILLAFYEAMLILWL